MMINLGSFNEMKKGGGSFSGAIAKLEY